MPENNENSSKPTEYHIKAHPLGLSGEKCEFNLIERTKSYNFDEYTPIKGFRDAVAEFGDRPFQGTRQKVDVDSYRDYNWRTYREVAVKVDQLRDFLRTTNLKPGDNVIIYGRNREEWLQADLACMAAGLVSVPLYDALGIDNLMHIGALTEAKAAFVDKRHTALMLSLKDVIPSLELVVSFDPVDHHNLLANTAALYCERLNIDLRTKDDSPVYNWDDVASQIFSSAPSLPSILTAVEVGSVPIPPDMHKFTSIIDATTPYPAEGPVAIEWNVALTRGNAAESKPDYPLKPEDTFSILFSSGTTGTPKGVIFHCSALVGAILQASAMLEGSPKHPASKTGPQFDIVLSFLPLAHVFQRAVEHCFIWRGDAIGYYSGNVKMLMGDLAALKPTVMIAVPRVLTRVYNSMRAKIDATTGLKHSLLKHYLRLRHEQMITMNRTRKYIKPSPLGMRLVYSKFRAALGGSIRQIWCGSAPIDGEVLVFLKEALCLEEIYEGYGMTETACTGGDSSKFELRMGHLAVHTPGLINKIVSVPGQYDACPKPGEGNPKGELCLKGSTIFKGYYKDEETTRAAIDEDGWFHTGDVAEIVTVDGHECFKLVGRLKNVMKLSQGEFVNLSQIDSVLECPACPSLVTLAKGTEASVVVICTVDIDQCKIEGLLPKHATPAAVQEPAFRRALLEKFKKLGAGKLRPFEFPKSVHITPYEWTPENKLLTPTMKTVRGQFMLQFERIIDDMYAHPLI
ncbi:AMP-binding enzyme [Carpediemonas membranifera]|uniref:AMP-binding enzyme n=1 Tax=Carpediemonas membranifera TaxID=201153 RepID=A0A8J6E635_9EUKA|nr:AMP-binding enzyme [Carpediemonas membranifera]|eukprot:KAG9396637.1 AMP-binding enzyme [Carpediemonas membranifera]